MYRIHRINDEYLHLVCIVYTVFVQSASCGKERMTRLTHPVFNKTSAAWVSFQWRCSSGCSCWTRLHSSAQTVLSDGHYVKWLLTRLDVVGIWRHCDFYAVNALIRHTFVFYFITSIYVDLKLCIYFHIILMLSELLMMLASHSAVVCLCLFGIWVWSLCLDDSCVFTSSSSCLWRRRRPCCFLSPRMATDSRLH